MEKKLLHVGIDIGSTTTKIAAVDETGAVAYSDYQRHGAQQVKSVRRLLKQLLSQLPDIRCRLAPHRLRREGAGGPASPSLRPGGGGQFHRHPAAVP